MHVGSLSVLALLLVPPLWSHNTWFASLHMPIGILLCATDDNPLMLPSLPLFYSIWLLALRSQYLNMFRPSSALLAVVLAFNPALLHVYVAHLIFYHIPYIGHGHARLSLHCNAFVSLRQLRLILSLLVAIPIHALCYSHMLSVLQLALSPLICAAIRTLVLLHLCSLLPPPWCLLHSPCCLILVASSPRVALRSHLWSILLHLCSLLIHSVFCRFILVFCCFIPDPCFPFRCSSPCSLVPLTI